MSVVKSERGSSPANPNFLAEFRNYRKNLISFVNRNLGFKTEEYDQFIIDHYKSLLLDLLNKTGMNLLLANTIFLDSEEGLQARRRYFVVSKSICFAIIDILQTILTLTNSNVGFLEEEIESIYLEIKYINGILKSDKARLKNLKLKGL